jgi:hypothetical protein
MAVFSNDPADLERLDWRLLRNGSVALYFRHKILDSDVEWLRRQGYDVREFDCSTWSTAQAMHVAVAAALSFPEYYVKRTRARAACGLRPFVHAWQMLYIS